VTTIRAPRWQRVLSLIVFGPVDISVGVAVAAVAFVPGSSAKVFVFVLGAGLAALGLVLTVRAPRVAVHLSQDTLRYDGFLVSWEAPRAAITTVLDDAFVEWRDAAGRERRRQIGLLTQAQQDDGTTFAPLWRWRREALLRVREWAGARAV
jgi:hypothetical protein